MNHTFNQRPYNQVSFDLFLNSTKDSRQKKSNCIYNTKSTYKEILSGSNYSKQHNTIFNNYHHLSSLTKCNSMAKLTKTQSNSYISSKSSLMTANQEPKTSPFQSPSIDNVGKKLNEKSISTMQSTDERKELSRIKIELKEKNDIIKTLHKTIDDHVQEKNSMIEEIIEMKMKLAESKLENSRIKQENKTLQLAYQKIKNQSSKLLAKESKLFEIISILNKDEKSIFKSEEDIGFRGDEQSLSGICFTDKIQMESIDTHLPALNFNSINHEVEDYNDGKNNNDYNNESKSIQHNKSNSYFGNNNKSKIIFKKTLDK